MRTVIWTSIGVVVSALCVGCDMGSSSGGPLSDQLAPPGASDRPANRPAPAASPQPSRGAPGASAPSDPQADSPDSLPLGAKPTPQQRQAAAGKPVDWHKRYGPAYPHDRWRSLGRDLIELPETMWDDTKAIGRNPWALGGLAAAGVTGLALAGDRGNHQVADHFRKSGNPLHGFWDSVGDAGGSPGTHFAIAGAMYAYGLSSGDNKTYETSKTLINALAINGLLTLGLKGAAHTESPNGDPWGWPSGHTSSSFAFASVMHQSYGPWVGAPFYAFAAFVGYERCAARNHDFNDVISGALIGLVIGHVVGGNHQVRILGADVVPVVNPSTGVVGIGLMKQW